jgi:hypothetical protein
MNVFLIIVIIIVSLIIIMKFVSYLFANKSMLQDNIVDATTLTTISATTLEKGAVGNNNFSYSTWFYVSDWNYRYGEYKVILGRMSIPSSTEESSINGINGIGPCPVISLGKTQNNISIMQNCYNGVNDIIDIDQNSNVNTNSLVSTCEVSNIPIQKWVNLIVSVYGRTLDVYIDGKLVKTCLLPGIAKVDPNADLLITPNGGFNGWTSRTQYWATPMNPDEAWSIYSKSFKSNNVMSMIFPNYSVKVSVINNNNNSENNYTL